MPNLFSINYTICQNCDRFVETGDDDCWHLDNDENEDHNYYEHDAEPSEFTAPHSKWREARPDLFLVHEDEEDSQFGPLMLSREGLAEALGVVYITKTVREVFEALEKNGFEHIRGDWFRELESGNVAACVIGQAALNLSVDAKDSLHKALDNFAVSPTSKWYNDEEELAVGSAIIYWNDLQNPIGELILETYAEVVAMAKDIMEEHFDKTVRLRYHDYGLKIAENT